MREVEIIIKPDGTSEIDLKGFNGQGCADIADKLAKALGQKVKIDMKSEFYQIEQCQQTEQYNG